jgi:hypothetical protein
MKSISYQIVPGTDGEMAGRRDGRRQILNGPAYAFPHVKPAVKDGYIRVAHNAEHPPRTR